MGNTTSGEENNTTNSKSNPNQHTNMSSNLPKTDLNKNTAPPPGWSVIPPQQMSEHDEKKAPNVSSVAPPSQRRLYPNPPSFDENLPAKQPIAGSQYPTAPEASNFMYQQTNQPPEYSLLQGNAQTQDYKSHQFMQQEKHGIQQFYGQHPDQKQPVFYPQPPVVSNSSPNPVPPLMPFNSSSMGINSDNWVKVSHNNLTPNAFRAGYDTDGTELFICRAAHVGDIIPGKMVPSHKFAYIAYEGKEHAKGYYEVLVGDRYRWILSHNGQIPSNAVEGGRCSSGEKLYIGRAGFRNSLTPGKVHPSHMCLYIPYGGQEQSFTEYEILVHAD